jgi:DNA-binding PadR family transcriptional regulator
VPRKYYRLTEAGREELKTLTVEWTRFASAMQTLLGQSKESLS